MEKAKGFIGDYARTKRGIKMDSDMIDRVFNEIDTDGDGTIDRNEMFAFLKDPGSAEVKAVAPKLKKKKTMADKQPKKKVTAEKLTYGANGREKVREVKLPSGATYTGEWLHGMRDGQGEQVWPDGSRYIGQWSKDVAHGNGKLYHADGDTYEGDFAKDKANGRGTYSYSNGGKYVGEWKDD